MWTKDASFDDFEKAQELIIKSKKRYEEEIIEESNESYFDGLVNSIEMGLRRVAPMETHGYGKSYCFWHVSEKEDFDRQSFISVENTNIDRYEDITINIRFIDEKYEINTFLGKNVQQKGYAKNREDTVRFIKKIAKMNVDDDLSEKSVSNMIYEVEFVDYDDRKDKK